MAVSDELFSRLDAINRIIGGQSIDTLEPDDDAHDHQAEEAAPKVGGMTTIGDASFTGGTLTEARKVSGSATPGATALMNHLLNRFEGGTNLGIYANRNIRGGKGLSVHAEGRAGDYGVPVVEGGHALGHSVADYLAANADRLGVQRIIFARKAWNRNTRKWVPYNGQSPHLDHVHWEITPEAAGRPELYEKGAAGSVGAGVRSNSGDLFTRVKAIHDMVATGKDPKAIAKQRAAQGHRDVGAEMARRFAAARKGKLALPAGEPAKAAVESGGKGKLQQFALEQFGNFGWSPSELGALIELWNKESGWNPTAQNPTSTAFGIAQFLNGTWAGVGASKTSDPYAQIIAGLKYIKGRYGSPAAALAFHRAKGWY